jgi:hypothetical protein
MAKKMNPDYKNTFNYFAARWKIPPSGLPIYIYMDLCFLQVPRRPAAPNMKMTTNKTGPKNAKLRIHELHG